MLYTDVSLSPLADSAVSLTVPSLSEADLKREPPLAYWQSTKNSHVVQRHYQQREDLQKLLLSLCVHQDASLQLEPLSSQAKASLETQLVQAVLHQEQNIAVILEGLKSSHTEVRSMCVMVLLRLGAVALPLFEIFQRNLSSEWLEHHPETADAVAFVAEELRLFGLESQVVHPWLDGHGE